MGVYKEAEYFGNDAFFEQLFKHEGYCVWNDEDLYEFMSDSRKSAWPEGCAYTGRTTSDGSYLYLDLKPTLNGNMTYGLYVDSICKTEYTGSAVSVDAVAKNMGLLYGSYLDQWNDGLEVYKVCQPCKAYNLQVNYSKSGDWGSGRNLEDYYYDPNEGYFRCDDDADYTNVNQCMKFRSHAQLEVASWEDLVIATEQGGMLDVSVGGTVFGTEKMSYEQQKYLEELWAKKRAKENAEYQALLATVPSAKPMQTLGFLSLVLGPLSIVASLYLVGNKRLAPDEPEGISEPLVSQETTLP